VKLSSGEKIKMPSGKNLSITELEVAIALAKTVWKDICTDDYIESLRQELKHKKERGH